mmetsp:Transcript_10961/g.44838  ORF Transcript_10961/g.44838 Transcript_10961/m.44838 type:complete len:437 (-) Transcript_10961:51-1361(-)
MTYGDEVGAIVVDVGSNTTKAGHAGDDLPKAIFPSAVGVMYSTGSEGVVGEGAKAVGDDAMEIDSAGERRRTFYTGSEELLFRRDHMELQFPLKDGLVEDWDIMESLWTHAFSKQLHINVKERPLLMVEPSFNTRERREKLAELLFEKFEAPAAFLAKDAVLNCFAAGRANGVVLDCGSAVTRATPVYDGYALKTGIVKSHIGGDRLDKALEQRLKKSSPKSLIRPFYQVSKKDIGGGRYKVNINEFPNTHPTYRDYMVKAVISDIRHSICHMSETRFDPQYSSSIPTTGYELPNGKLLELGGERFEITECLFNPEQFLTRIPDIDGDKPFIPLPKMLHESVNLCDPDIRKELMSSIMVSGGNSVYPGFGERLGTEVGELTAQKVKVIASSNTAERRYAAWIGGSILGSLGSFHHIWMSKAEYEERGKSLVERKCP